MAIILPNEDEAKRLLDFNQKFPVDILDRTLASVNMCIGELPQVLYNLRICLRNATHLYCNLLRN